MIRIGSIITNRNSAFSTLFRVTGERRVVESGSLVRHEYNATIETFGVNTSSYNITYDLRADEYRLATEEEIQEAHDRVLNSFLSSQVRQRLIENSTEEAALDSFRQNFAAAVTEAERTPIIDNTDAIDAINYTISWDTNGAMQMAAGAGKTKKKSEPEKIDIFKKRKPNFHGWWDKYILKSA